MAEVSPAANRLLEATTPHRADVATTVDDGTLTKLRANVPKASAKRCADWGALLLWAAFSAASQSITVRVVWFTVSDDSSEDDRYIFSEETVTLTATAERDEAGAYISQREPIGNPGMGRARVKVETAHASGTVDIYCAGVQ